MKLSYKYPDFSDPHLLLTNAPLSLHNQPGVMVKARTFHVYSASLPTRDQVRNENYKRRLEQMSSRGYRTPINEPYRIIGDPIVWESDWKNRRNGDSQNKVKENEVYLLELLSNGLIFI